MEEIVHRKGRGVCRLADADRTTIVLLVIDAIRHGSPQGLAGKIMDIDRFGLLTPDAFRILEVAYQLLFLGVDAQGWVACCLMCSPLLPDIAELGVSIRMCLALAFFDIQPQAIPDCFEQAANDWTTHPMTQFCQTFLHISQAAVQPLGLAHRIASGVWLHHFQEHRD